MGYLRESRSGRVFVLDSEVVIGRSPNCGLHIDESVVSAQHAGLRSTERRWLLRDFGSRNGTFLDGERVLPGESRPLQEGARLAFGALQHEWKLEDATLPQPAAVAISGTGAPVQGPVLGIPSADDPRITLYREAEGVWMMERPDEPRVRIRPGEIFQVDGEAWRFLCPQSNDSLTTTTALPQPRDTLQQVSLHFSVSRDEEHVELRVQLQQGREHHFGSRAHLYLLVTLARHRLSDARQGLPDTSCGWVHQDDLLRELHTSVGQLNIEVFRIRKQFAVLDLADAAAIIERRPRAKQLRIGVRSLAVETV
jgi:FHA domain